MPAVHGQSQRVQCTQKGFRAHLMTAVPLTKHWCLQKLSLKKKPLKIVHIVHARCWASSSCTAFNPSKTHFTDKASSQHPIRQGTPLQYCNVQKKILYGPEMCSCYKMKRKQNSRRTFRRDFHLNMHLLSIYLVVPEPITHWATHILT